MILITGATGNVGRHVVAQLLEQGLAVRALTRNPEKAQLPAGAEVVAGDLMDPAAVERALKGVSAAFLFAVPGSAQGFVAAARATGLQRIVFLSSGAVVDGVERQADLIAEMHAEIERAIEASGLEWTFLRPSIFAANAVQWAWSIRASGSVSLPYPGSTGAPIDEADIAAVAVQALTTDRWVGRKLMLTGPESLSQADQLAILGDVLGRPISVVALDPVVAREQMERHVPVPIVAALFKIWADAVGVTALVTGVVAEVTGRPARTFREWASDHQAIFLSQ